MRVAYDDVPFFDAGEINNIGNGGFLIQRVVDKEVPSDIRIHHRRKCSAELDLPHSLNVFRIDKRIVTMLSRKRRRQRHVFVWRPCDLNFRDGLLRARDELLALCLLGYSIDPWRSAALDKKLRAICRREQNLWCCSGNGLRWNRLNS